MVMLSCDFRAVFESKCHCAILVDRHLVDYSKPQFFVKLKALYDLIEEKASGIREYDDNLAARIIRQVTVLSKEQISVKFNEIGIELEMSLNG